MYKHLYFTGGIRMKDPVKNRSKLNGETIEGPLYLKFS